MLSSSGKSLTSLCRSAPATTRRSRPCSTWQRSNAWSVTSLRGLGPGPAGRGVTDGPGSGRYTPSMLRASISRDTVGLVLADAGGDRGQGALVDQPVGDRQPFMQGQVPVTDRDSISMVVVMEVSVSGSGRRSPRPCRRDRSACCSTLRTPRRQSRPVRGFTPTSRAARVVDQPASINSGEPLPGLRLAPTRRRRGNQPGRDQDPPRSAMTHPSRRRGTIDARRLVEHRDDPLPHAVGDHGPPRPTHGHDARKIS